MSFSPRARFNWLLRSRTLRLGERTHVMGIVNVTPDSFSDGGAYPTTERAVAHAVQLLDEGADILDVGGESTRPGSSAGTADAVSEEEEQRRVLPVLEGVLKERPDAVVSVDTYRAQTARVAVLAGAQIVNDVSGGLWDRAMFSTCAQLRCGVLVMHTRGLPSQWAGQAPPLPGELLPGILRELQARVADAKEQGIEAESVAIDAGFGFGKRGEENWMLLRHLSTFADLCMPLLAGLSRKGFLAAALPKTAADARPDSRDDLTHAAGVAAVLAGAHLLRVHDVAGAVRAAAVADQVLCGGST